MKAYFNPFLIFLFLTHISCVFGTATDVVDSADLVLGQTDFLTVSNNAGSSASASSLSGPQSVFFDGTKLYIADTNNNRVLIWNSNPSSNKQAADVVVGQADMTSNSENRGGAIANNTLSQPTSVHVNGGKLFIADKGNHRILIYNSVPTSNGASASSVIGQADMTHGAANRNGTPSAQTLNAPTDVFYNGSKLFIADTENNRVLVYDSLNTDATAFAVVGKSVFNNGGAPPSSVAADTLKNPTGVYATSDRFLVCDTKNNRVLIYNFIPKTNPDSNTTGASAHVVIGQTSMTTGGSGISNSTLSGPTDIHASGDNDLLIADKNNNRVLIYDTIPGSNGAAANRVLGQAAFDQSSPNRGGKPEGNTLSGPTGVFSNGSTFWIADTVNNRALRFPRD